MSFLDINLSAPKQKVYISITPGVGVELIQMDYDSNTVSNYACRELEYDEVKRDIANYDDFKNAVSSMYEELGINPKSQVIVNIPIVMFGVMQLGLLLPNDAVNGAVQSEVEQTYLFRQTEPLVAWQDGPGAKIESQEKELRPILYSAIQRSVAEKIAEKLSELGSSLVGIKNSLSCTFRALEYMGVTVNQMLPEVTWNLMIINDMGYTVVSMSGKNVVTYYEEPIPLKTFDEEEMYDELIQSAQMPLSTYPANYLYVVSDTDTVSAEEVANRLNSLCITDFLENNSRKKQDSIIPVSINVMQNYEYLHKISLQAVGCALSEASNFPLEFDYLQNSGIVATDPSCTIPIGAHEYTITKSQAQMLSLIIAGILVFIFVGLGYGLIPAIKNSSESKAQDMTSKLEAANSELKSLKGDGDISSFDLKREVEIGVKANRAKLMNFVAPGENIPDDVWLTYFMTQGNGLVDIKGESSDVSSVYVFFKSMRDSLNSTGSKLKLQNLEMISKSVDAAVSGAGAYKFEITNMTSDELKSLNSSSKDSGEDGNASGSSKHQDSESVPNGDLLSDQPID